MKIYEIKDYEDGTGKGILLYFEKAKEFLIELVEDMDEWTAPLLFSGLVKKGIFTVPRDLSRAWIEERVIPSGRQNINDILTHHHLKEYDEMKLLELSEGRCSQDTLYIRKIEELPDFVLNRMRTNISEFVILNEALALCIFADGTIRKIPIDKSEVFIEVRNNPKLLESGKVGCGGYYVTFNDSIDIPASVLYNAGVPVPLTRSDVITFIQKNVLDTTQSCKLLNCSRQNLSYLVKQESLLAAKSDVNGSLFMKGDVLRNMW
ncbi:MAG: hypothetical protein IJM23_07505 [Lachnospiraceae bacterium]|nr:hypothetical protein [Lachnospiraceae bacterium]